MAHDREILALYTAHRSELVSYADGIVRDRGHAEDVVQEAYLRLNAASAGRVLDEPLAYLYRIVRNLAIDGRRRRQREARYVEPASEAVSEKAPADRPSPEAEALARDELRALQKALSELPERTRIALEMHRFGGCKLVDIAAELGVSKSTAHELVMQGLLHCRRRMAEEP